MWFLANNFDAPDRLRVATFIVLRTAYRYDQFPTLLQLTQTCTWSGLLLRPHPASWAITTNGSLTRGIVMVLSLAPEYAVKPDNFSSRSVNWSISIHWSDTSIKTKQHGLILLACLLMMTYQSTDRSTFTDRTPPLKPSNMAWYFWLAYWWWPSGNVPQLANWVDDVF
jgi:hypothetical protein